MTIKLSGKSMMYIKDNNGLRIDPWGTAAFICANKSFSLLNSILYSISVKESFYVCEERQIVLPCKVISKAFQIIRKTVLTSTSISKDL